MPSGHEPTACQQSLWTAMGQAQLIPWDRRSSSRETGRRSYVRVLCPGLCSRAQCLAWCLPCQQHAGGFHVGRCSGQSSWCAWGLRETANAPCPCLQVNQLHWSHRCTPGVKGEEPALQMHGAAGPHPAGGTSLCFPPAWVMRVQAEP